MPQSTLILSKMVLSAAVCSASRGPTLDDRNVIELLEGNVTYATYASLLRQCGNARALMVGKRVHAHMMESGYDRDKVLGDLLVQMYGKCRSLDDARAVFDKLDERDVFSWSIMIAAYAQNGDFELAIELYKRMERKGVEPDMFIYSSILGAFCRLGAFEEGKGIHSRILDSGLKPDVVVQNALVNLYAKCGNIDDARSLFDEMPVRTVATWNAMIAGYAQLALGIEALELYWWIDLEGVQPDVLTFINILGACSSPGALGEGKAIHARVHSLGLDSNVVLATALLNMYAKCGSVDDAKKVFSEMSQRNEVSWNAMIAANAQYGHSGDAMALYHKLHLEGVQPNAFTFASILGACNLTEGIHIHACIVSSGFESDDVVQTALVNMYSKHGSLVDAREVFDKMLRRDTVAWNAMIAAYTQFGHAEEALDLFYKMPVKPDVGTLISAVNACSIMGALAEGRAIHARVIAAGYDSNLVLQNGILNMYAKCGSLDDTKAAFDNMPRRSVVSWNALINANAEQGNAQEAFKLLREMDAEGMQPNMFTFSCIVSACSMSKSLREGKAIHARIRANRFDTDVVVVTALVDMYTKCGTLDLARKTFDEMPCSRNTVSWNTMIGSYAQHGHCKETLELFHLMNLEGGEPNETTLTCALHACTHAGRLSDALELLSLTTDHAMLRTREHYACMVDLLGRAGRLDLAEDLIKHMPLEPGPGAWRSLLGACSVHGDMPRGSQAAQQVAEMQPQNAAPYVLLSNIYKHRSLKPGVP